MRLAPSLALVLGLLLAGCDKSTSPSLESVDAEAAAACGPTDGPAVTIRFASASGDFTTPPIVQAMVYRQRSELAGKEWVLPSDQAHAWLQRTTHLEFDPATEGRIAIEVVEADGTIVGTIDAKFPDGTLFLRTFRATWQERALLCA